MNLINKYLAFSLLWVFSGAYSQLPHGGNPYPYPGYKAFIPPVEISGFDIQKAIDESLSEDAVSGKKPFKFARNFSVDLSPENSGTWEELSDGTRMWRIHLISRGALGVSVDFSDYQLKPGCFVFIYPPSQNMYLGGFNYQNNNETHSLPVTFLEGEELVVELQVPPDLDHYGSLKLGNLSHAFIDIFSPDVNSAAASGSCNVNINCPDGKDWQLIKKAVCHVTFTVGSSKESCTGTLINNTRQDTIPYLLTANHCIRTVAQAASAVFKFDYELDTCGKKTIMESYSLSGSVIIATSDSIDFTLLRLNESPPDIYKPFFAGWSISEVPALSSVCIHHPQGDVKKISVENNPLTGEYQNPIPSNLAWLYNISVPKAFWRVTTWEKGTTEGGSSGSPLFNQDKLIVGNLTGGAANCTTPVNDYFSKFYMGWDYYSLQTKQLKNWLDPDNSGITSLRGFNPFGPPDTVTQVKAVFSNHFALYPNPANSYATFESDSHDISGGTLSVYSLTGKKMLQFIVAPQSRISFDVSVFEQGIYIIEFSKANIKERKRLFVINQE